VNNDRVFRAFEYSAFNTKNGGREGKELPKDLFNALKSFTGEKELPYYSLTANGVRLKNYVGALQVGKWTIEVLPKLDRTLGDAKTQSILIQMLRQAGFIKTSTPSESNLKLRQNYILEAYLLMFLEETRSLLHQGLIKKYRKKEENAFALKGSLKFNKHISKNLTHAERFFVRHTIYDKHHELNQVLLKTLNLISTLSVSHELIADANRFLLLFPELKDINVSEKFFGRISWGRKSEAYRKAIEIARLLLLNYHPDLSHGRNNVLALMFDMNDVWEKWFARRLRLAINNQNLPAKIIPQSKKTFWIPLTGRSVSQKPDIVIIPKTGGNIILDTKWKLVTDRPSEEDLRQMFAYNRLFRSNKAFLIYPGENEEVAGDFFNKADHGTCGLKFVSFLEDGKLSSKGIEELARELLVN